MGTESLGGVTEMTWTDDGDEVRIVRFAGTATNEAGAVELLQELLECSRLEAEHAYTVILEDGEFITSVYADIDDLG